MLIDKAICMERREQIWEQHIVGRIYCTCWWTEHGEYRKEKQEGWVSGFWFWPNEKMMAANPTYSGYRQNRTEESVGRKVKSRFNFRHVWGTSE